MLNTFYFILYEEKNIPWFVEVCNDNQGFISVILAVVSLFLSFLAIKISISSSKGQIQAQLFERRIDVYSRIKKIYIACEKMVEEYDIESHSYFLKLSYFISKLFDLNSEEFKAATELLKMKDEELTDKEKEIWLDKFCEIIIYDYQTENELENLRTQIHLIYSVEVEEVLVKLLDLYQELRMEVWNSDEKQLDILINKIKNTISEIKNEKIFKKMDEETISNLPVKMLNLF